MENLSGECHKKNFKILITFLTLVVVVVVFCFIGILFCYNPILTTYKVEYINGKNDILIQTYSKGEKLYLPDSPQKYGYNFIGWSFDKEENNLVNSELVVDKELTLYAKWEQKVFDLVFNGQTYKIDYCCAFDVNNESLSFIDNQNRLIKIDKVEKDGYSFIGWELSDDDYSITDFDLVDLDKFKSSKLNLNAMYSANSVKFSVNQEDGFTILNMSHKDSIKIGETLAFNIVLSDEVNNSKIMVNSTSGNVNKANNGNAYLVEISNFTEDFNVVINNICINEYEITFVNGEDVVIEYFEYGEIVQWPSFEKIGYELVGFKDGDGNMFTGSFVCNKDLYLEAVFEIKHFTVEFPKNNGKYLIKYNDEVLVNSNIAINYFESLEFEVVLSAAYTNSNYIVYAMKNGIKIIPTISNGKFIFDNIDNNIIIYIDNVNLNTYTVIVDSINYGKFDYGSFISITEFGFVIKDKTRSSETRIEMLFDDDNFGGWLLENGEFLTDSSIQDLSLANTVTINGNYSKHIYVVTLNANGGYLENDVLIFIEGDHIILPTISKENYKFAGWYVELVEKNTIVDQSSSIKFNGNLTNNIVLYAGWIK